MREAEFREWMESQGYDSSTITTQVSRVKRLEQTYGDLDNLYPSGGLAQLQMELSYSKEDARNGKANPAPLTIEGSIYNGLSDFRRTIEYYRTFSDAGIELPERREQAAALTRLTNKEIEGTMDECDRVGIETFLKVNGFGRPSNWVVGKTNQQNYPAKAVVAVALGKLPNGRALRSGEFFGGFGEQEAFTCLRQLGYDIINTRGLDITPKDLTRDAVEATLDKFDALGEGAFMAAYGRGKQGVTYYIKRGEKRYPSKAIANSAYRQLYGGAGIFSGSKARQQLGKLGYEIVGARSAKRDQSEMPVPMSNVTATAISPTNLILFGPPGTGKTYITAAEAVLLCDGSAPSERDDLMERYEELRDEKRIGFVTFHQSYDYENFVEGLRPSTSEQDGIGGGFHLKPEPGIFREICALADQARLHPTMPLSASDIDFSNKKFWKMSQGLIGTDDEVFEEAVQGNYIALGWGGTIDWSSSQFTTAEAMRKEWLRLHPEDTTPSNWTQTSIFRTEIKTGDIVIVPNGNSAFRAVAQVEGDYYFQKDADGYYAHRRNVRWLLVLQEPLPLDTIVEGNFTMRTLYSIPEHRIKQAALSRLVNSEKNEEYNPNSNTPEQFVLIIDEINRANISKVFGELITLIEPDKRLGMPNQITLKLPYSKREFGVPSNLHIIGTMNTADRSIAQMDTALRRRFQFREIAPEPARLAEHVDGVPLRRVLQTINDRIEYFIDRDHRIGHAFFMGEGGLNRLSIDNTMRFKVIPLIQEYFFEDWDKVAAVLGEIPEKGGSFLGCRLLSDPTSSGAESRPSWRVLEEFSTHAYDQLVGQKSLA